MRRFLLAGTLCLLGSVAFAQSVDIPLDNWTVPPFSQSSGGGITTMTDVAGPRVFVPVQPCRVVDTRNAAFPAGYGPPALAASVSRNFDINSQPNCPGIPASSTAYSLNFTVTQTQGPGFLKVFPQGGSVAADISTLNYVGGQTIANAAIVPVGTGGGITVIAGVSGTELIIDINGYFASDFQNSTSFLFIQTSGFNPAISATNQNTDGGTALAGTTSGGTAVSGIQQSSSAAHIVFGVQGGANSTNFGSAGVFGQGVYKGVTGLANPLANAAGVFGTYQSGVTVLDGYDPAGVRGEGASFGVLGISPTIGAAGSLLSGGHEIAYGLLGSSVGTDPNCVGGGSCGGPWGVFAGGNIGATGTKHFLDPHPTNPKIAIGYISLEGPEAGTYFRGRGRFQNGIARIPVPEHFRVVTDPEGLTVQITPIGAMATVAVMKMDLNEIVVKASRNVEFSYLVQGVRATFKDVSPVRSSIEFMPRSADAKIPQWLSPLQKAHLIENGTYREDGTANVETARAMGWDRIWEQHEASRPSSAP